MAPDPHPSAKGSWPSRPISPRSSRAPWRSCRCCGNARGRAEELRRVPDETLADLHASGLFRMLQPRRVGGSELPYRALVELGAIVAAGLRLDRLGADQPREPSLDARHVAQGGAGRGVGPDGRRAHRLGLRLSLRPRPRGGGRLYAERALAVLERHRSRRTGTSSAASCATSAAGRSSTASSWSRPRTIASSIPGSSPVCAAPAARMSRSTRCSCPTHRTLPLGGDRRRRHAGKRGQSRAAL